MSFSLKIHNTRTGKKENFVPANPDRVTLYACGPTVYNLIHIGNARPIVVFDTLYRLLKRIYPGVVYARNITDVDDKINQAALENNEPISALTERFTQALHQDIAQLNTLPPDIEPRATDHIEVMISLVERLLANDHAYAADGHVLFSVESMPSYGNLSHRKLEDMEMGARVAVADYKRHPGDFVLWKPSDENTPGWESPWGVGRPGWHLECSAMIEKHLGKTIDIHAGGRDLIFPHHENERAQSCCANPGEEFVRYWMHNGFITMSGDKMSKSEGNFFTLRDVLQNAPGEAVRHALLSGHYRSGLDWSEEQLAQSRASMDSLYTALRSASDIESQPQEVPEKVMQALVDDLNTPNALAELHRIARELNKEQDPAKRMRLKSELLAGGHLMGLLEQDPEVWFRWTAAESGQAGLSDDQIDSMVERREAARRDRDFARADQLRDELQKAGVELEDSADGTRWRRS